jgi:hypothetical protein
MRRLAVVILLVYALALAGAAPALAEGSSSIAAAPTVTYGQQEFGMLSSRLANAGCAVVTERSWWLLPVIAGDAVTIDWEVQSRLPVIEILPAGTNDFNSSSRSALVRGELQANNKGELTYQATMTATLPVGFGYTTGCDDKPGGPYNFTASVIHALVLGLPPTATLARRGTLSVAVHSPDGEPINNPAVLIELQIKGRGGWKTIGVGTAASPMISYKIPARLRHNRHITLRALAHGTGYAPASSAHLKVHTL